MDKPVADKSVEEHYQDAEKYLNEENYDKAIEELLQILSKDPNLAAVYNLLGIAYLKQNKSIQSAIGSFQQAIRVDPSFTDAYFNLGITYAGAGNEPLEAVKYFEKAIEINPKFAKAYMGLGWVTLFEKKDPEQAEVLFQKAIDVSENKLDEAYFGLGMAYVTMGKKERALGPVSVLRSINRFDLAATLESLINEESKKNEVSEDGDQPAIQPAAAETPAPVLP
ncbi:MAG: tetratricopeptide repeat protein [Candidatus Omnitrophica bacterium]|nr:tetratricopeptide repeat protein [Candidatus Omnitrophota bacterium]